MARTVCLVGTLDTKGSEYLFVKEEIQRQGLSAFVVDCSTVGEPAFQADVTAQEIAAEVGRERSELLAAKDPAAAIAAMSEGAANLVARLYREGEIHGLLVMGGGQGTAIGAAVMAGLPMGFPKVLVSTIARVDKTPFLPVKDALVMDPITDIVGMNGILRTVLTNAARAVCGMARDYTPCAPAAAAQVGISIFGVTTPCAERVSRLLAGQGFETLVFHATGIGGATLEELAGTGSLNGVIDLTLSEVSQELFHGLCAGGPHRLEAAGHRGVPQIVVPGGVDFVNYMVGGVPAEYIGSHAFHMHNDTLTVMRLTPEESGRVGRVIAEKVNLSSGPVEVILPLGGVSAYDKPGMFFWDPAADRALFQAIRETLLPRIPVIEAEHHINDPQFAQLLADRFARLRA